MLTAGLELTTYVTMFVFRHSGQMLSQAKQMQSQSLSKGEKRGILLEWFHSTASAKEKAVLEYIKDLLEGGKKFICFAHHQVSWIGLYRISHN